jgi:hypothetical protein
MFKQAAYAVAAAAAFVAAPASAATTVTYGAINPGGTIVLTPAGPGAVSSAISFDVQGSGAFTALFNFFNPFSPAAAGGSAVFNFDPDLVTFTGGDISGGGTVSTVSGPTGASIQIDRLGLPQGFQTLTINGTLTPSTAPGGNSFARIGGQLNLTGIVPEPTTWALFILGFGVIGGALRRRNGVLSVSKAKLNFA